MNCVKCSKKIPKERLKALPDTKTCVKCSDVMPKIGLTIWDDTASTTIIVNNEELRYYENGDARHGL